MEWLIVLLLLTLCGVLLLGFPVAFSLAGVGLIFILVGTQTGLIDEIHLRTIPNRLFGIFNNRTLIAVPMFVFMGLVLERSGFSGGSAGCPCRADSEHEGRARHRGHSGWRIAGSEHRHRRRHCRHSRRAGSAEHASARLESLSRQRHHRRHRHLGDRSFPHP